MAASAVHQDFNRMGSMLQLGVATLNCVYACSDGYIVAATGARSLR